MSSLKSDNINTIKYLQKRITSADPNAGKDTQKKILRWMRKLEAIDMHFEELEETGIGRTINGLRKLSGDIGNEAAKLVAFWKKKVKEQVDEEEKQQLLEREKSEKESQHIEAAKRKSSHDDGACKSKYKTQQVENEIAPEQKSDVKATHLITLKSRSKRKPSEQLDDGKESKYAKVVMEDREQSAPSQVQLKSDSVDVSPDKMESNHSDEVDTNVEKSRKERSRSDKKHKKGHEKRHKTSKHSHKSDRHDRHHSKSSHSEKKRVEENGESSPKHHDKNSKSKSKSDSTKHDRKVESSKTSVSESKTNEKKSRNANAVSIENHVDSTTSDDFGAALLNIPSTSIQKKRSTSSKASTYQDSSPPSQRSLMNFDMFSTNMTLEPLDSVDDFKDADFYHSPNSDSSSHKLTPRIVSEEDMLNSMIVTKNQKTKVYSGNKSSIANVPSLQDLCVRILQENFDALEFTGGVPFNILKPILEKVTAQQLYTFENYNPYLIGETDDLWKFHAKRDFRKAEQLEYESWRDLYLRCFEERETRLQTLTKNISVSIANSAPVRKTLPVYFDTPKPPRNVLRSQAKHGTGSATFQKSSKQSPPNASQSVKERISRDVMGPNAIQAPSKSLLVKKKKAPLMQKSLQLMKGLKR